MPWYKAGTVSVAQNSTTVTGTNTTFAANSRVGDAFRGPDGGWYEVVNITSDTVLSISPAYLGTNAAAGVYALAPMQGYVKQSADALRALVDQFGTKLAELGSTGNYEVLPVNKGGTGGTTPAEARTGLELGTVATENTVPIEKGGTGSATASAARLTLGLASQTVDAVPIAKGGTGGTTQAAARTGLGLGSAAIAAILGIVSQSGGIPTGAIMERGITSNGSFAKYADGTLICLINITVTTNIANGNNGGMYYSDAIGWNYPASFLAGTIPYTALSITPVAGGLMPGVTYNPSNLGVSLYAIASAQVPAAAYNYRGIAIGRWY
jgi:hypothetical protein